MIFRHCCFLLFLIIVKGAWAEIGDPQIRTDHPFYPGELAMSTFERLFKTQAEVYEQVTGKPVKTEEDKALAAWFWRNTHYFHVTCGARDLWGKGLGQGGDKRLREYWNGMFGYGFGLCGTTHSQWTAEMNTLLGHGRGRGVGANGHIAFEVFLKGGAYGKGQWALLDHDLSTVIFDEQSRRLLSIKEMQKGIDRWIDRGFKPEKQRGWLVCGLHPSDGGSYRRYAVSEPLAGYAGPPPMVHLRNGERMRRYFQPGLEDGKTFVFWGRNVNAGGIPGPERSRTWVNQPEKMHGSKNGTPHVEGQVRFANVEYIHQPRDGQKVVTFQTPYIIGATPADLKAEWGIYEPGCRNGLVLKGNLKGKVAVSVDAGRTWLGETNFKDGLDLTDYVKGRSQYWLRFDASEKELKSSNLEIRTVCQANVSVFPRLKDGGTKVTFAASNQSVLSLGPEANLAETYISAGAFGEKRVTLTATPNHPVTQIYAAAHVASSNPPNPKFKYQIEYSLDGGKSWKPVVKDWNIPRHGQDPGQFWSQSFCYGSVEVQAVAPKPIQIRFHNDGGKRYLRAEAHLVQKLPSRDPVTVTYNWTDHNGTHELSNVFFKDDSWNLATRKNVRTNWVEMSVK